MNNRSEMETTENKKSGFVEYGRFPNGIRYGDSYTDKVFMYLKL